MKRIIVSSSNKHKIDEIKKILKGLKIEVLSKDEVGLEKIEVEEDGTTLEENAMKKAKELSNNIEGIIIADDTGLFVDELNGAPGVYSARYGGENASYEDNNKKLLNELKGIPLEKRTAKFKTVIAIVMEDKSVQCVSGECSGKIGYEPKGNNGFGYDPLFIVDKYDKTFAELGEDIKNKISHRANALLNLRDVIESVINNEDSSIK